MRRLLLIPALGLLFALPEGVQAQLLPPAPLVGPGGGAGFFGVREVKGLGGSADVKDAYNKIASLGGTISDGTAPIIDLTDPETNANGGPILGGVPIPFLTNTAGDDNDIQTVIKGKVRVPSAGNYTFQVRSDDGFALRIPGYSWTSVSGAGVIDPADPQILAFPNPTGDSDTRGVINLPAADVDVEFVAYENGGGAYWEVSTAQGAITAAGDAQWLALGDGSTRAAFSPGPRDVRLIGPATVINGAQAGNIAQAMTAISAAILDPAAPRGTTNIAVLRDGDDICCGRPGNGIYSQATVFPNGGPDNFSTGMFGSFRVDDGDGVSGEDIQLTFGLFSDDGSALHIFGESFTAAADFTGDGNATIVPVDGDGMLSADYFTGNSNAFGLITLKEGNYGFEAFEFEGGGDSGMEIWFATGDHLATGFSSAFYPLSIDGAARTIPANAGLAVVPEPSSLVLAGLGVLGVLGLRRRRNG